MAASTPASTPESTQHGKLAASNNTLGLKLLSSLKSRDADNAIFSPLSISTALAMTYMGARGNTAKQIEEVMALGTLGEDVHKVFKDHNSNLRDQSSTYTLKMANRLYGQKKCKFQTEFLNATHDYYGAKIEALDFGSESARKSINTWVEEQTERKITNLISPGVLTTTTRLVLVNAIYFKGDWDHPFDKRRTSDQPFHLNPSEEILIPTMFQKSYFRYLHDKLLKCKVLKMGYKKHKLEMMFVLPNSIGGLATLETKLSPTVIQSWSSSTKSEEVKVSLPKFKFTKSFSLAKKLSSMGMTDLFSESAADLSGITSKEALFVSDVIHQAYLDVNEEGCEAAAATAVSEKRKSLRPPVHVFKADHPFLFFIQSTKSGSIVFMGRVTRPTQSNE